MREKRIPNSEARFPMHRHRPWTKSGVSKVVRKILILGMTVVLFSPIIFLGRSSSAEPFFPNSPVEIPLPYPHVAIYSGVSSVGWPLTGTVDNESPPKGAPINQEVIDLYSRNQLMVLSVTPLVDLRPDILAALRVKNPDNLIFAYIASTVVWCPFDTYPEGTFWRTYWEALEQFDGDDGDVYADCKISGPGFLWHQGDPAEVVGGFPSANLAYRVPEANGTYRYAVSEALADVIFRDVYQSRKFDGIFLDMFGDNNLWQEAVDCGSDSPADPTLCFDYVRAGYDTGLGNASSREAYVEGWKAGHTRFMEQLRELVDADGGSGFPLVANGGPGPEESFPFFNGWMRENYPYQNGGSFYSNLFRYPEGGYLFEDSLYRVPRHNFIFSAAPYPDSPFQADNILRMRFGLASASLGDGWAVFGHASMSPKDAPFFQWWYDEYGVDLATGAASDDPDHRGYLGQPLSEARQMIFPNPNPELVAVPSFETDLGDYRFVAFSPAVATSELVDAGSPAGGKSLHVVIDNPGNYSWLVNLQSKPTATFPVTGYIEYGVTFWAKAGEPGKAMMVDVEDGFLWIPLSTSWKQYQARVAPMTSNSATTVRFDLGEAGSEIWLDDIHVQRGISSVYRRDFDNGIVLVNPSETAQTVTLEEPFRKIRGSVDSVWNDGAVITELNLPGAPIYTGIGSAIFLLRNNAPVANAGLDQVVPKNTLVTLDGTDSFDPDGDSLAYSWTQAAGPPVTLTGPTTATPTFTPSTAGTYSFSLTVNDGFGGNNSDLVTVTATNGDPVANAGPDQIVPKNTLVTLNGTASSDPDGDLLAYQWTQDSGPAVTLGNPTTPTSTVMMRRAGVYAFSLALDDGDGGLSTDSVIVTVHNRPPIANAGSDWSLDAGASVHLDGGASFDPDGDAITFAWTQVSGPTVTLTGANAAVARFTPTEPGTYVFRLTVTDAEAITAVDTVQIRVEAPFPVLLVVLLLPILLGLLLVLLVRRRRRRRLQPAPKPAPESRATSRRIGTDERS